MLIRVHRCVPPPGLRDRWLATLRAPWYGESPQGFRGRLVAESPSADAYHVITFWKDRSLHDAAFLGPSAPVRLEGDLPGEAEAYDAVRDLPGIYADLPTATGSAVHARLAVLELSPGGLATLRAPLDQRLASHPRLLAGSLAAKPERPDRLVLLLLFPDEDTARSLDARTLVDGLPPTVLADELLGIRCGATLCEDDRNFRKVFRTVDAPSASD